MKRRNVLLCTTACAVALLRIPTIGNASDAAWRPGRAIPDVPAEQGSPACDSLLAIVRAPTVGFTIGLSPLDRAAVEADRSCVPALETALQGAPERVRRRAAAALSIIGGPEAVEALRREFDRTGETWVKSELVTAIGTLGQAADTRFLVAALEGEQVGNVTWPPIERAALTLGILRFAEARDALASSVARGGIAGGAARDALSWLGRPPCRSSPTTGTSAREGAILSVLQCGVPHTAEGSRFFEREGARVWEVRAGRWSARPASSSEEEQLPRINFGVHTSHDGSRAIVAVGMSFGPRNGSGYGYTLEWIAGEWVVRAIVPTWIS